MITISEPGTVTLKSSLFDYATAAYNLPSSLQPKLKKKWSDEVLFANLRILAAETRLN